jgi:hypothetical protein
MLFRNRRLVRVTACYFLLQTVSSLLLPTVSLAMMGPSQPEFTSYEAPGATDLVNLVTGDLSYSVPVLDIPGPERGFSLPLTYKAGIQLEQEASWVGLGWSLNPGAIARSVNGYPDDANNEPTQTTFNKKIDRGWNSSVLGIVNLGWNSITGHSGSVDLIGLASVGWDRDGVSRGDLVGIGYTAGQGVSVDPVRLVMAAVTVATIGGGSVMSTAANVGIQGASSVAVGVGMSAIGLGHLGGVVGFNNSLTRSVESHLWGDNYWNFFNNNTTENAFGSLYFGKMSQNTVNALPFGQKAGIGYGYNNESPPPIYYGTQTAVNKNAKLFRYTHTMNDGGDTFSETAADIYQDLGIRDTRAQEKAKMSTASPDVSHNREVSRRPISTAHDYFSVMGEGVSGTIRPYRLDVGSVAYPKLEGVAFQEFGGGSDPEVVMPHFKHMAVPFLDTKVGFRYENSLSNGYDYPQYTPTGTDDPSGFTLNAAKDAFTVTDARLLTARTAPARKGLYDTNAGGTAHLVTGKHVTWYSNAEISALYTASTDGAGNGFLEFEHPKTAVLTSGATTNNKFRALAPPSGIGAFAVTAEDGTTYHYSLPVYQYQTYFESKEVTTTIGEVGKMTKRTGASTLTNPSGGQATTWLLTAITSSDYIDRNNSGTVDAADWGGWVKFEYGKFSSRYKWRQPYIGTAYTDDNPTITSKSFTEGYKETYYLNSIATRSHTALFVKSLRQDGRGHFQAGVTAATSKLGIDERQPASSLRLDEIILLDNATLTKLYTAEGTRPALTNATGTASGIMFADDPISGSGDDLSTVLDMHDLDANSQVRQAVNSNALKRIHFNYGYDLCRGTPSSFQCQNGQPFSLPAMTEDEMSSNRGGKLTLKSISFFGPTISGTPTKIIPDFTFDYDRATVDVSQTNPGYGKEKWDGFGMYQSGGREDVNSHGAQDNGAPWSLTKVTSPLGGITEFTYERDQYAHVSEYGSTKIHISNNNCSATFNVSSTALRGSLSSVLKPNQPIYLTGTAKYSDCVTHKSSYYKEEIRSSRNHAYLHEQFWIKEVNGTQLTLTAAPTPGSLGSHICEEPLVNLGADFDIAVPNNVVGGDIRVAAITTREGTNAYQVRYKYTLPNSDTYERSWYNSTGVIAKEPPFINHFGHPIEGAYDYPTTPVLYSQVSVLRGLFRNDDDKDYETREVYSFHTPVTSMISEVAPDWKTINDDYNSYNGTSQFAALSTATQTAVDVGKIGQPSKVEIYNRRGERELSTDFTYASTVNNADAVGGQGHYTEGVLNTERVQSLYRVNRSTKQYLPAVLVGSRSTRNGLIINNRNVLYDFLTGQVLETAFTNSLGRILHSRSIPAYTLAGNEGMKAKGDNPANRHMLAQQGAFYTYQEVPGGPTYNPLNPLNPQTSHVLSAGVQTWQPTWQNYREADANGNYQDVAGQTPVWRQAATYSWQSPLLAQDGSFKDFIPFVWTGTPDAHWVKGNETVRYDHYSHVLESRDLNGSYAAQRTGYNQTQLIASATNARYTEVAYSGAEDQLTVSGTTHFGGEVVAGGTTDKQVAHTGFYSNKIPAFQTGFIYRTQVGRDVDLNKMYRVSAWVHANAPQGKIYAALNGTRLAEASRTSSNTRKAGAWYLLTLLIKVPPTASGQKLEFGCANDGTDPGNFDDFRVAPLTATITSKVYDPRTNNLLYSLDNDNIFTHYEYTPTGRLKRVYQETLDGTGNSSITEKLVKEYDFNYASLFFPTWVTTLYRCVTNSEGNNTGYEERKVEDVNPLNKPPMAAKWELNGASLTCPTTVCEDINHDGAPRRVRNNICEIAQSAGTSSERCQENSVGGWRVVYHWLWGNDERAADTYGPCQEAGGGTMSR